MHSIFTNKKPLTRKQKLTVHCRSKMKIKRLSKSRYRIAQSRLALCYLEHLKAPSMKTKLFLRSVLIIIWIATGFACKQSDLGPPEEIPATTIQEATATPLADVDMKTETKYTKEENSGPADKVWVCKSAGATKYHYNRSCGGLKRCSHTIEASNVKEAEAVGLTKCAYKKCR